MWILVDIMMEINICFLYFCLSMFYIEFYIYLYAGDVPYYIVRNSWGYDFGHEGYIYIKIGANVCGKLQTTLRRVFHSVYDLISLFL
jgi:hypothetical protein